MPRHFYVLILMNLHQRSIQIGGGSGMMTPVVHGVEDQEEVIQYDITQSSALYGSDFQLYTVTVRTLVLPTGLI